MADPRAHPRRPTEPASGARDVGPAAVTTEEIAARAYEISQSDAGGSSEENWLRAARELGDGSSEVAP